MTAFLNVILVLGILGISFFALIWWLEKITDR